MAMRKKTVLFVTGTRAEWGLFASTVLRLKKSPRVNLKVLVTGMHTQRRFGYTLEDVRRTVPVAHVVPIGERDNQLQALSKEIDGIGRYLTKHPTDAILVVGDRDEPFAAALAAVHLGIPLIHVAGGDVTGPTVDQYLRNAMTLFSNLHLVQTKRSRENVLKLGAHPRFAHVIGAPGLDGLTPATLPNRKELASWYHLDPRRRWFLVVLHPTVLDDTPISEQIDALLTALQKLDPSDEKIVLYPNADDGNTRFIAAIETLSDRPRYHLRRHLPRSEYLGLMQKSAALIGNTSSGLMEAGCLHVPFVHVGNRQKNREHGPNVIFVEYRAEAIVKGVKKALTPAFRKTLAHRASPYHGGAVAERTVRAIEKFLQTL